MDHTRICAFRLAQSVGFCSIPLKYILHCRLFIPFFSLTTKKIRFTFPVGLCQQKVYADVEKSWELPEKRIFSLDVSFQESKSHSLHVMYGHEEPTTPDDMARINVAASYLFLFITCIVVVFVYKAWQNLKPGNALLFCVLVLQSVSHANLFSNFYILRLRVLATRRHLSFSCLQSKFPRHASPDPLCTLRELTCSFGSCCAVGRTKKQRHKPLR